MINSTTRERPWCLYDIAERKLNEENPFVRRLTADQRAELVRHIEMEGEMLRTFDNEWNDPSSSEAKRWHSPKEGLVNGFLWVWIGMSHPEWMGATVDAVLRSAGLPPDALACLDDYEQHRLALSLCTTATEALENGCGVPEILRRELIEWLQDWIETDEDDEEDEDYEDDLATLVELVQSMCGGHGQPGQPKEPEGPVDWCKDGF